MMIRFYNMICIIYLIWNLSTYGISHRIRFNEVISVAFSRFMSMFVSFVRFWRVFKFLKRFLCIHFSTLTEILEENFFGLKKLWNYLIHRCKPQLFLWKSMQIWHSLIWPVLTFTDFQRKTDVFNTEWYFCILHSISGEFLFETFCEWMNRVPYWEKTGDNRKKGLGCVSITMVIIK